MLRNIFKIIVVFIVGAVGGVFADQILWPYFVERPLFYKYQLEPRPVYVTEKKETIIEENIALKEAIEKTQKTIIGLKRGQNLIGSGLIVSSDGLAITFANLVPSGASGLSILQDGKLARFEILKRDLKENLVLLKIEGSNFPTAGFSDLSKKRLGERVFLVAFSVDQKKIANEGIIRIFSEDLIQTNISEKSIAIGSPLFDIEGNVVGLNTIDKEGKVAAIPISKIRQFLGF